MVKRNDKRDSPPSALILAAGMAERMGECKVLLPLEGRPALVQLISRMRSAGVENITIVTGGHEKKIRKAAAKLRLRVVHNPAYKSGMFSSVLAGVRSLPHDTGAFFLLPADTPLIKPVTYRALMESFHASSAAVDLVYPTFRGVRGHPPLISRELIGNILGWGGVGGLRGMFEEYAVQAIDVPTGDRAVLLDMDTPDDYTALRRYQRDEWYPDDEECAELLEIAGTPQRVIRHMDAVARCCALISDALGDRGVTVNRRLLAAAAKLHDLAKTSHNHDAEGARWLRERGYGRVAGLVGLHKDMPDSKKDLEAEILYFADRITDGEAITTLEQRLYKMETRFAAEPSALEYAKKRLAKALTIQKKIEKKTGKPIEEILSPLIYPLQG